jgi:BCD family chlorophyll transporter-like MFS transporter
VGKALFESPLGAYGLVFLLQALGLLACVWVLRYLNAREFQDNAQSAITAVMAGDLD